jgi:hypothetical protein
MAEQSTAELLTVLASPNRRPKVHDAQIVFKAPKAMKSLVEEYAKDNEMDAATIYRAAVGEYLERRGFGRD